MRKQLKYLLIWCGSYNAMPSGNIGDVDSHVAGLTLAEQTLGGGERVAATQGPVTTDHYNVSEHRTATYKSALTTFYPFMLVDRIVSILLVGNLAVCSIIYFNIIKVN